MSKFSLKEAMVGRFVLCSSLAAASLFTIVTASSAGATTLEDMQVVQVEGVSKAATETEAVREIQSQLVTQTARAQAIEALGESRYSKNKAVIENKIVKQAGRYIPYVNPGKIARQPDGSWKMPVEMRVSVGALRRLILEEGILKSEGSPLTVLPMVSFYDRTRNTGVRWWVTDEKGKDGEFLRALSQTLHSRLEKEFAEQGLNLMKPELPSKAPSEGVLTALKSDQPSSAELESISQYFQAPMIMKGEVRFRDSRVTAGATRVSVKLRVFQVATGRVVAEVSNHFETLPGEFNTTVDARMKTEIPELMKQVTAQVRDSWHKGTLGASLMRVSVQGELSPRQLALFKSDLIQSVREVKGLRERLFEKGRVVFEMDYMGESAPLIEKLKGLKMPTFQTKLAGTGDDKSIALEVKAK